MPTLSITTTYSDNSILTEAHLDEITSGIETFLNDTKIDADNIQTGAITATCIGTGAITAAKLGTGSVETAKLADDAVTAAKLADSAVTDGDRAVTTNHIRDSAVTTAKINDLAVTTAKLDASAVTTAKIAANNVTRAKLEAVGQQISSSCGDYTNGTGSLGDITNLSVSLTTTGRPVYIGLMPADGVNPGWVGAASTGQMNIYFYRGATLLSDHQINNPANYGDCHHAPGVFWFIDTPSAGTYTYKASCKNTTANGYVKYVKLIAYEL